MCCDSLVHKDSYLYLQQERGAVKRFGIYATLPFVAAVALTGATAGQASAELRNDPETPAGVTVVFNNGGSYGNVFNEVNGNSNNTQIGNTQGGTQGGTGNTQGGTGNTQGGTQSGTGNTQGGTQGVRNSAAGRINTAPLPSPSASPMAFTTSLLKSITDRVRPLS
ncbi:hypothetical protein ACFVW1_32775 [Streptomyces olivochromogenes]|uniref:hypothetical protein n=1 Tax=Streptomyces olivochromogenes TaxID=1963 RepID=UPI0036DC0620